MMAAERTTNKWKRHLGCLWKEGMEARVVTKAESGPEISQMGGRQAVGQMVFSVPKCSKWRDTPYHTFILHKEWIKKKPRACQFFLELTCVISLINFACLCYPFAAFFKLRPSLGALSITLRFQWKMWTESKVPVYIVQLSM